MPEAGGESQPVGHGAAIDDLVRIVVLEGESISDRSIRTILDLTNACLEGSVEEGVAMWGRVGQRVWQCGTEGGASWEQETNVSMHGQCPERCLIKYLRLEITGEPAT